MPNDSEKAADAVNSRFAVGSALNEALAIFTAFNEDNLEDAMNNGILPIADAIGLDRVGIYKYMNIDGTMALSQKYRWDRAAGGTTRVVESANTLPNNESVAGLYAVLSKGGFVNVRLSDLSGDMRDFVATFGVKAIMIAPVFSRGDFWGVVTLQDHTNDRRFDDALSDLFCTAARLCASFVIRAESTRKIEEAISEIKRGKRMTEILNETAIMFLSQRERLFEDITSDGIALIVDALKIDRLVLYRNFMALGVLHSGMIYRWDRESGGTTPLTDSLMDVTYERFAPRWEQIFSAGKSINSPARLLPEAAMLQSFGCVSVFITPIFTDGAFWGFAVFEDRRNERYFDLGSAEMMRSAAFLCANAVITHEKNLSAEKASRAIKTALIEAREANNAKSAFLSHMSHEMRTPMNAIIGMAAIGKNAPTIEQKDHALNKIGDASAHLLGIINDVLDMAKIEANKMELSPSEYDFKKMLQKAISIVGFRLKERKQKFSVNIDGSVPRYIYGDEQRLLQVVTNLLSNAVKFTPDGGEIRLDAFYNGETDDVCELRVVVTDNGIGISPEQQKKLFQAFEQADSGISRRFGGTGLGLAITKRIVELMGGAIYVESQLGKGARFTAVFKARRGAGGAAPVQNEKTGFANGEFSGKRLLLAEDIEINREIFIALMENTGFIIDCAENGRKALDMIASAPDKYDMVFMDVQMPEMDGLEATRRIRALPGGGAKLPIIAMTANVFKDDIELCLAAGMNAHVGKPLDVENVLKTMREFL